MTTRPACGAAAIDAVLDRLPTLAGRRRGPPRWLTDDRRVCRLALDGKDHVVRLPGRRRFIEPAAEHANQQRAAAVGVAVMPLAFEPASGAIVSPWLAATPLAADADVACALARLHHRAAAFVDVATPRQALAWNLPATACRPSQAALAERLGAALDALPAVALVNLHGDVTAGNVVTARAGGDTVLLDFEYAHRGRASWDLATWCDDRDADAADTDAFLAAYNEAAPRPVADAELILMRAVVALVSAAWWSDRNPAQADAALARTVRLVHGLRL